MFYFHLYLVEIGPYMFYFNLDVNRFFYVLFLFKTWYK